MAAYVPSGENPGTVLILITAAFTGTDPVVARRSAKENGIAPARRDRGIMISTASRGPETLSLQQQAFDSSGLGSEVRQSDFRKYRQVLSKATKDQLVADAVASAANTFNGTCGLRYTRKGSRYICVIDSYPKTLVLRKIAANLSSITMTRPSERSRLIKVLLLFLTQEIQFRLYRFDVRRFFDSLSVQGSLAHVADSAVSRKTVELLAAVLREHTAAGKPGIPTGLAISAALAELMMDPFDQYVRSLPGVFYLGRFVDDIVVITCGEEDVSEFERGLLAALPPGTSFGAKKQDRVDAPRVDHGSSVEIGRFDYLGYEFKIRDERVRSKESKRVVDVDLSERSVKRLLTRTAKAFRAYASDGRFDELYLRICYLTSNYRLFDPLVNRKRLAGVYHNHPFLTYHPGNSLQELDGALRRLVFDSPNTRAGAGVQLNAQQRRMLAARSFVQGHMRKQYRAFDIKTLALIKRCWLDG
jgi:hypothetical protein